MSSMVTEPSPSAVPACKQISAVHVYSILEKEQSARVASAHHAHDVCLEECAGTGTWARARSNTSCMTAASSGLEFWMAFCMSGTALPASPCAKSACMPPESVFSFSDHQAL
jgi:hypothetical protein